MARTPPLLAARIDRLARAAHRFHRFAHHPLCDEYRGEVIALGRRARVCRGCASVLGGGLAGALGAAFVAAPPFALVGMFLAGIAGGAIFTFLGRARHARPAKLVSRFLPAVAIAFAIARATAFGAIGIACAAVAATVLAFVVKRYRRRGPDRTPCAGCPERHLERPCRGIAPIVRRERAFRRLAGQWLLRSG
ncbi:MAG: hypothetical protein ABW133_23665 [Polyangiaceae bacterium]